MATIYEAAMAGDVAEIERLVADDPTLATVYNDDGWTALHLAAHFGKAEAAQSLLNHNADIRAWSKNDLHNQPIHAAAAGGHTALVRLLIDHGADVSSQEHGGYAPLHLAADNGDGEMVEVLLAHGADSALAADDGKTATDFAAAKDHTTIVNRLTAAAR